MNATGRLRHRGSRGGRTFVRRGAAVAAIATLLGIASPVEAILPEGCIAGNPFNVYEPATTGPCSYVATTDGQIGGRGEWIVTIERSGRGTITITSDDAATNPACLHDPPFGTTPGTCGLGTIVDNDEVSAEALTPGSVVAVGTVSANPEPPVHEWGSIVLSDGVELRYTVDRPASRGPFPVALYVSPYSPRTATGPLRDAFLEAGYAVVFVGLRGTGCSGGQWDVFQPASDTFEIVEWAAAQEWSTGDVGTFGFSAVGVSQLITAGTRPPSLRAAIPNEVPADIYRDFGYIGGIMNPSAALWTLGSRQAGAAPGVAEGLGEGDPGCATNNGTRPIPSDGHETLEGLQRPYIDHWWNDRNPITVIPNIDVPILTCQAWQDDQALRSGSFWIDDLDAEKTWAVFTNGYHGICDYAPGFVDLALRFFDRFVRGTENGFETEEPRVQIWHETTRASPYTEGLVTQFRQTPSWITTHPIWPVDVEPVELYFRSDGRMTSDPPADGDPDGDQSYLYPMASSPMPGGTATDGGSGRAWGVPPMPEGFVAYTSDPLGKDLEVFGPGSVDLWLASTAPDTDLQVTLTEVRPDGHEMYVQRGWLRASRRTLDPERSTVLRPFHTHLRRHTAPLTPLEPVPLRIEINPFGHVFRKDSAVRIYVETPNVTGQATFAIYPVPARNTIISGPDRPSRLVLGKVPGGSAQVPLPACDPKAMSPTEGTCVPPAGGCDNLVVSQPCRLDPLSPTG